MFQLPGARFRGLPVGADEKVFFNPGLPKNKEFTVFFYATMLPLHGLDVILEAIEKLKDYPIKFVFSGGDDKTVATVAASKQRGAHIEHHKWIAYDKLREYAARAHLTLGGPFGNTTQANMVITGKTYQFLACGTAVMVGQTKENQMLKDQQNSLVVPLGDARALAHKIIWAYKHQNRLPAIAAAGKKLYNEQFSSTAIARQLASLLGELE
jgi:glycosyltransferase involved in cell wall biosynthesis